MFFVYLCFTIFILIFEMSLRDIVIFSHVAGLYIFVNLLFWNKKYKLGIIIGVIVSILLDLFVQNDLGRTLFSTFTPLLILSVFDGILQIDSKINRIVFSVVGTITSIVLNRILFVLVFFRGELFVDQIVTTIIVSSILIVLLNLIFSEFILKKENTL